ncbi:hypothetical protein MNBD_CHLOROFLEXI01-2572, partial [hydrothermal vent metagenome]
MNKQGDQQNNGLNSRPKPQRPNNNGLLGLNLPQKSIMGLILV